MGKDAQAEADFQRRYPQCRYLFADPDPINADILAEALPGGSASFTFVDRAVGAESGIQPIIKMREGKRDLRILPEWL